MTDEELKAAEAKAKAEAAEKSRRTQTKLPSAKTERTLIAEYVFNGERLKPGRRLALTAAEFTRAVDAGVVHKDDALDAELTVNDPDGLVADEDRGSGPSADRTT